MKATDLMIGDWVSCDGKCYQIAELGGMVCLDAENELFASIEDIEPIRLTPEILEKNGFRDISTHTLKGAETFELWLGDYKLTYKLNDYFALDSLDDRWYRLFETQFCHRWCVHHLQHALKLCGIDKEIKL